MNEAIRIKHADWGDGYLEAVPGNPWTWKAIGSEAAEYKDFADFVAERYEYSPADGKPGFRLAQMVAAKIPGATLELPPLPPPEGLTVY